eukprot:TRINITY_DN18466_c0_g1_i2.p1 TRINITY_DN18466_c0_g1~~TRINITY_DN18466_c0_g1_i2.p1  ORF type:complete len:510 (+),score=28.64 TRINITY_DN18466_c0_g1_i2:112-1641(+)
MAQVVDRNTDVPEARISGHKENDVIRPASLAGIVPLPPDTPLRLTFGTDGIVERQRAGGLREAWPERETGHDIIQLTLRPGFTAMVALKETGPVLLAILLASLLSSAAGYLLFGYFLHGPGESDDFEYWTTCNATLLREGASYTTLTPLAEAYPLEVVRMKTSGLKFWSIAAMSGFISQFLLQDVKSTAMVLAVCSIIAFVATGSLVHAWLPSPTLNGRDFTDQSVSLSLVVSLFSILALRTSPLDVDSSGRFRWPRAVYYGSLSGAFLSEVILTNASYYLTNAEATALNPTISAALCLILLKIMDYLVRVVLKYTKVPPWPCLCVAFIYESSILYVIRRSVIRYADLSDVVLTTAFFCIIEALSTFVGILYCIYLYNLNMKRGHGDLARRQMAIFFLAIISDMAAEHAALQASLGLIAIDSRVYDIEVDSHVILVSWVIQFLAECGVDVFVMVCMVAVLPVSIVNVDAFERRHLRQILFGFCFYIVSACVFIFTPTLHLFIREDSFVF